MKKTLDRKLFEGDLEKAIAILATINDCQTALHWKTLHDRLSTIDFEIPYGVPESVSDATRLFSYISLRKLDDFLAEKKKSDDLHWSDFGLTQSDILRGQKRLLPQEVRQLINKSVAHLTIRGELQVQDYEKIDDTLNSIQPSLNRLRDRLDTLISSSAN